MWPNAQMALACFNLDCVNGQFSTPILLNVPGSMLEISTRSFDIDVEKISCSKSFLNSKRCGDINAAFESFFLKLSICLFLNLTL